MVRDPWTLAVALSASLPGLWWLRAPQTWPEGVAFKYDVLE